jgi:hypothetical protein
MHPAAGRLLRLSIALSSGIWLLVLSACGGGGDPPGSAALGGTGTVGVLIADGPADDYDHIFVTITEVTLIPSGGDRRPVVLFASAEGLEVDLLKLRDEDLVLALRDDVPAGKYAKVRLRIKEIRPVGGPCAHLDVMLPSGKIDLEPRRGAIELEPGGTLFLRLDIDADKSLSLHVAGHSGLCIFRPVVFVEVRSGEGGGRCPRALRGEVSALLRRSGSDELRGFLLRLSGERGQLEVLLEADTAIFDEHGMPAGAEVLSAGAAVEVRGSLDHRGRLRAIAVVLGEVLALEGKVAGPVADGRFAFDPDTGQAVIGRLAVGVAPETLILIGCDERAGTAAIVPGVSARVTGKLSAPDGVLHAVLILLEPERPLSGEITALVASEEGHAFVFRTAPGDAPSSELTVLLPPDVPVVLEGDGAVGLDLLASLLACRARPARVRLAGGERPVAKTVELRVERRRGTVASVDAASRRVVLSDGGVLELPAGATVLELGAAADGLMALSRLRRGDSVTAFGLEACPGAGADFIAFVLLVHRPGDGRGPGSSGLSGSGRGPSAPSR